MLTGHREFSLDASCRGDRGTSLAGGEGGVIGQRSGLIITVIINGMNLLEFLLLQSFTGRSS
jgi:ABC-type xylose transport system permease subunit